MHGCAPPAKPRTSQRSPLEQCIGWPRCGHLPLQRTPEAPAVDWGPTQWQQRADQAVRANATLAALSRTTPPLVQEQGPAPLAPSPPQTAPLQLQVAARAALGRLLASGGELGPGGQLVRWCAPSWAAPPPQGSAGWTCPAAC